MSTVNFYDVLDVSQDCTSKEIKNAYRDLALIFHPDKKPYGDAEMFELITKAYNILINKNSRKEYDELYKLSKQSESNHFDLKVKSKDHFSALDNDVTKKKSKTEQKNEFDKIMEDMDRKHGYKRDKTISDPLKEKKTNKRLTDLQLAREQDDIENIHEKLFEGGRFDIAKFNAAFDVMHKGYTDLIPHTGNPLAYNLDGCNFSSLDTYEDLYAEDDILGNSEFGSVKLIQEPNKKLTKSEINKISAADYTSNHNYIDKDYKKSLEDKMRERELFTKKLDDRELVDFDGDDACGGYGILSQIGLNSKGNIEWDDDEDVKTRYKKLLELRKQN